MNREFPLADAVERKWDREQEVEDFEKMLHKEMGKIIGGIK